MKVRCLHGYFIFEETEPAQLSEFASLFGLDFALKDGYYTFSDLLDAPEYSIVGGLFLGAPTTKTFEGRPWEVMRENELVYDFNLGKVKPIATETNVIQIDTAANYFLSNGMILAGSITQNGDKVRDYDGFYQRRTGKFKYSQVGYE
jgi:hypothetical protein